MVWFVVGFIFGAFFGFGVMALLSAAKEDEHGDKDC